MSIRTTVITQFREVGHYTNKTLPPLTDELLLFKSGLDSLGLAILVVRLEDSLGLDPFDELDGGDPPVTLGELIQLYERAAESHQCD